MQSSVEQAITLLPDTTLVGIISYGSAVYVHEMQPSDIPRCVMFRGSRETSKSDIGSALAIGHTRSTAPAGGLPANAYFVPLSVCSFVVESILEGLRPEMPAPV